MRGQESYGVQVTVISWDPGCAQDHGSPQPATRVISGLTKTQTPTLMEMLPTCLNVSRLCCYYQQWIQPLGAQQQAKQPFRDLQRTSGAYGHPPSISDTGTHHKNKGPEQEPKLSPLCADAEVAGKQMESKVVANSQVVPVCFVKPA